MKRWSIAASALAASAAWAAPQAALARAHAEFAIAPQPLESALIAFTDQTHASFALPESGLAGAQSPGVTGRHDEASALRQLLSGTGFSFARAGEGAYRIIAAPHPATPVQEETIIVTAARAPRALQDLPRSISDIGAERLAHTGARDLNGLSGEASGISFTNVGTGRNKPYLRGLSDGAATGRAQSTVGLYLDGVRLTYAAADPDLHLIDVKRVDVLRGPQGALYGAGSIGGVIAVESNAPDSSAFYGSILGGSETTSHGGAGYSGELVVNAPLIADRLAVRYAGYAESEAGWLDNVTTGASNSNETTRRGSRFSAQYDISSRWRLRAFAADQGIDSADSQYLSLTPSGYQRNARLAEPHDNDFVLAGITLHGETGLGDIESTTAHVRHQINSRFDAAGSFAVFSVDPNQPRPVDENNELSILVHETRVSAPVGARLPWFAGIFLADGDFNSTRTLRDGLYGAWPDIAYRENRTDGINEFALFGEMTWRFTSEFSLVTGARYFSFEVKTQSQTEEPLLALNSRSDQALTDSGLAPDIRLSYQPREDWLFYISAAEGYRSPGFNSGEPIGASLSGGQQPFRRFASDELWTYETGARIGLFDGRVALSGAAFLNQWRNAQTDQLVSGALSYTGNIGDVRAYGFEGDLQWMPTDALTLRGHVLVNEPDIVRRDPSFPANVTHLPGAPELIASASIRYERSANLFAPDARWVSELSFSHVGTSPAGFENEATLDGYTETNLSTSLSMRNYEASLYITNLFDEAGETFTEGDPYLTPSAPAITRLRPMTLGFSLKRNF